jgi:hypothetical protein
VDYDQANTSSWSYVSYSYDAQNNLLSTYVSYDDGTGLVLLKDDPK